MNLHKTIVSLYEVDERICAYLIDNTESFEDIPELDGAHTVLNEVMNDLRKEVQA